MTTRGFKENEMVKIARLINDVMNNIQDEKVIEDTRVSVSELCTTFPIYKEPAIDEVPQL